jgi:hypothetical protein
MSLQLKICRDDWGTWSVHGLSPLPVEHLPSLSASTDYARKECAAAPATIELLIDGFYAVLHQERGWPRRLVAPETDGLRLADAGTRLSPQRRLSRFFAWLRGHDGRNVHPQAAASAALGTLSPQTIKRRPRRPDRPSRLRDLSPGGGRTRPFEVRAADSRSERPHQPAAGRSGQ